ncbi:hypothetical protein D3C84_1044790 [compost metagenome]
MRLTPISLNCSTVRFRPPDINTLTGFGATARTTASTSSALRNPGAYNTSAPASANACRRRIVSSRSGLPCRKFSARAVSVKGKGKLRVAATAASMRATACSKQ